ncbi:hypothetical protein HMPREF6123_1052 [Oribacterium sinus F0268]|uniref:Uncharacterized protein n=1 Tax=Oribacterium sinus F0268 TaxID=585501 RepID=C2KX33_9FIRM|nr:hypothetical protein HMPREF6123_1052 [Oribacterium sinus F0268]
MLPICPLKNKDICLRYGNPIADGIFEILHYRRDFKFHSYW